MMQLFRFVLAVSSLAMAIKAQSPRCKDGEEDKAVLFVNFDDKSAVTGWTLDCDGEEVLDTPSGSLGQQEVGSWYSDAVCITATAVCVLTIVGDGQSDREESYFAMRRGDETVAYGKLPRVAEVYWFGDEFMMEESNTTVSNPEISGETSRSEGANVVDPAVARASKTDCTDGETKAILFVNFDEKSLATGWKLTCDEVLLLDVPVGSLDEDAGSWLTNMACVPNTSTCFLTLLGDDSSSRKDSYFVFKYGNDTIVYDTLPRKSETFCIGVACHSTESEPDAQVLNASKGSEVVSCKENETRASLFINFDDASFETGWTLNCDGEVILDVPLGSLNTEAGSWYSETTCVSDSSTCLMTLLGGGGSRKDSYFVMIHGNHTVDFGELPQESVSFCFGADCPDQLDSSTAKAPATEGASPGTPMETEEVKCEDDEGEVDLFVFFDDRSFETGWRLDCDGAEKMNSPVGSLKQEAGTWHTSAVCVSDLATCTLTLIGEGGSSRKDSYFVLRHDNQTISYDTLPTSSDSICFGPDCPDEEHVKTGTSAPTLTAATVNCSDEEVPTQIYINFDDRSSETGWIMECDGAELLNTPIGVVDQEPGTWYTQSACTNDHTSCWLTFVGNGGSPRIGSFFLWRQGNKTVAFGMLPSEGETYCFGAGCDDVQSIAPETAVVEPSTAGPSVQETMDSSSLVTEEESTVADASSTSSPTSQAATEQPSARANTSAPSSAPTATSSFQPTAQATATSSPSMPLSEKPTEKPNAGSSPDATASSTTENSPPQETSNSQAASAATTEDHQDKDGGIQSLIRSRNFYIMLVVIAIGLILQIVVFCCIRIIRRKRLDDEVDDVDDQGNKITVFHANHGASLLDDDTDSLFEADNGA